MLEILIIVAVLTLLLVIVLLVMQYRLPARSAQVLEQQHRAMLSDLHDGLNKQSDRQAEHARADQELIQNSFRNATQNLSSSVETLVKTMDTRLEQISGKVAERLDEGFKKTNETFTNVMTRLATIDEAQKKIDGLTTNVVSLQHLLGDKRSRGAFGEVQLEGLVRNILPPDAYSFQEKLSNGNRVDCLLILPPPTGKVPVDAKFPLENYHRMLDQDLAESDKLNARKQFKLDIKKHIEDISQKYLIRNETSDGAVMFVPAEAVFAEIHALPFRLGRICDAPACLDRFPDHPDGGIEHRACGNERCSDARTGAYHSKRAWQTECRFQTLR